MNIRKSKILKVKNSLSELQKDFKKLRDHLQNSIVTIDYTCIPNQHSINLNAKKVVFGVKDKILSLFKINTTTDGSKQICVKNIYGSGKKLRKLKIQNYTEDNMSGNIRNLFRLNKDETIKGSIVRDIKNLFN